MKHFHVVTSVAGEQLILSINGNAVERLWYKTRVLAPLTDQALDVRLTELLEFFLAFYSADRLAIRSLRKWGREFTIEFPVTDPAHWNNAAPVLKELIWRSTGDSVIIVPTVRTRHHVDRLAPHFVLEHEQPTSVVMLSEGLDSLCGAFQAARAKSDQIAFTSIITNSRKMPRFDAISTGIREHVKNPNRLRFHRAQWNLEDPPNRQERTQRSRTMLAIATGLTVAAAYGVTHVAIAENGMGILNLPNPALQSKHESSQVLHPSNVRLWRDVSELLLNGATIAYPNRFKTKAEMCAQIPIEARKLIGKTSSCDAPQRADSLQDCGACGSCVFRKQELMACGLSGCDSDYSPRPQQSCPYDPWDVLVYQATQFRECLGISDHIGLQWDALTEAFPTLHTSIVGESREERAHEIRETISLLRRHVREILTPPITLANAV